MFPFASFGHHAGEPLCIVKGVAIPVEIVHLGDDVICLQASYMSLACSSVA